MKIKGIGMRQGMTVKNMKSGRNKYCRMESYASYNSKKTMNIHHTTRSTPSKLYSHLILNI